MTYIPGTIGSDFGTMVIYLILKINDQFLYARGSIFDADNGMKHMSWTGPAYLK